MFDKLRNNRWMEYMNILREHDLVEECERFVES